MIRCQHCDASMAARRFDCGACGISVEGAFATPRLARLSSEDQQLIESFVLCGGSLKLLAEDLSVSYPTVRKRIDGLLERLQSLKSEDRGQAESWLADVEAGRMKPELAARLMKEQAHG